MVILEFSRHHDLASHQLSVPREQTQASHRRRQMAILTLAYGDHRVGKWRIAQRQTAESQWRARWRDRKRSSAALVRPMPDLRSRCASQGGRCPNPRALRRARSRPCPRRGASRARGEQAGRDDHRTPTAVARGLRTGVDPYADRAASVHGFDSALDALLPPTHRTLGALPAAWPGAADRCVAR